MFGIVPKSVVLVGFAIAFAQKWNITSRIRNAPWPDLKSALGTIDTIAARATSNHLLEVNEKLDGLLDKVQKLKKEKFNLKNRRYLGLMRSINSADSVERECLIKIIGIPGLSRFYYMEVLSKLARQIGVPFKQEDVVMLKRLNSQPNLIDVPEVSISNLSYPIFIKFINNFAKKTFIDRWTSTLCEKKDPDYINRFFRRPITIDNVDNTEKIQIHGFRTMNVPNQYNHLDKICRIIGFGGWRDSVTTIYQSRYTKHLAPDGLEQLQTEGIIVKLRSRALKLKWMRKTRLEMLSRPKDSRKSGYVIHLPGHLKYKNRNFTTFIDEHLSTHKKNLFLIARARCNSKNWSNCWTWDGHVFVRRTSTDTTHRINTFEDINNIIR